MAKRLVHGFRRRFDAVPLQRKQGRGRLGEWRVLRSVVLLAALAGTAAGIASTAPWASQPAAASAPAAWSDRVAGDDRRALGGCRAVDGDTLRCGSERIRLLGIDTPELPGHCRARRRCVAGDAEAATRSLARAIDGALVVTRTGEDRYGRTLATVRGPLGDLSCHQLQFGEARYRADWDDGGRVRRACPGLTGG